MKSLYDVTPCSGRRRELLERAALAEIGDGHVVAQSMICLPSRLACHVVERVRERLPVRLDAEVDVARRAAEGGRGLSRREVVDRDRPAKRHVEVRVRVDAAGEDVLPRRVDHAVRVEVERLADRG